MNSTRTPSFSWIWPAVGPTPINQGLDSEMFDRTDFPYHTTFVREAIQNSLDARLDRTMPVTVRFSFHKDSIGRQRPFLEEVISHRRKAGLGVPQEWSDGIVKWLVVEDFNATGLLGDLSKRNSDFWNYWLNFGISSKDGSGRGGRGIGRVTFLIASQLHSVIGYTRRHTDGATAICGMCVLRPTENGTDFLSTHAYFAKQIEGNIYRLHDSSEFHERIRTAFAFSGYEGDPSSGLGLAIVYPHEELEPDRILAAAVENFAPAIMNEVLRLDVDGIVLDSSSIDEIASLVSDKLNDEAIRNDVDRYLHLVRRGQSEAQPSEIELSGVSRSPFTSLKENSQIKDLHRKIAEGKEVVINLAFPLDMRNNQITVSLRSILGPSPADASPIDRVFREGMSLPEVRARNPGELDLVVLVDEGPLATYLNLCEGKAHLDLLESKDVMQKLQDKGFRGVGVKRFVKRLPAELRFLLTPDITEPDAQIFDAFFSIPAERKGRKKRPTETDDPFPTPPPPKPPAFRLQSLEDGLKLAANPEYSDWPVSVSIRLAYADGSRRPAWSQFDFRIENLDVDSSNCEVEMENNTIKLKKCSADTSMQIKGFDRNRELDASIRVWRHA